MEIYPIIFHIFDELEVFKVKSIKVQISMAISKNRLLCVFKIKKEKLI
jgi:hypothetical protein